MKRELFKKLFPALLAALLLSGCAGLSLNGPAPAEPVETPPPLVVVTETPETSESPAATPAPELPEETPAPTPDPSPEPTEEPAGISEDGEYTAPEEVAEYLHLYGHLPSNFLTKKEAQDLGWPGGDLWKYAPGKSIGGDRFGNYEGLLPKGKYKECDVNYSGGSRGAERLIYGEDGSIWYTDDHYESFTQLY